MQKNFVEPDKTLWKPLAYPYLEKRMDQCSKFVRGQLIEKYNSEEIYNADETGVFYLFSSKPDKTLAFKSKKCHGGKRSNIMRKHGRNGNY